MDPYAVLLFWSLVTAPVDSPIGVPESDFDIVGKLISEIAIDEELLDPREQRYWFVRFADFDTEINALRNRYVTLKDAPKMRECDRFPPRGIVTELLTLNRAYNRFIDSQLTMKIDPLYVKVKQENQNLYDTWDLVRDSRCEYYYITVRRIALDKLKKRLGNEDYMGGILPPAVPLWRFKDITND